MKTWKLTMVTIFCFFAMATAITFTSCEKDPCTDLKCNDGTCVDGYCQCPEGFEGSECEITSASKFVGSYTGSLRCGTIPGQQDSVTIELINDPNIIRLKIRTASSSLLSLEGTARTSEIHFETQNDENEEINAYATVNGDLLYVYLETFNKSNNQRQTCQFSGKKVIKP